MARQHTNTSRAVATAAVFFAVGASSACEGRDGFAAREVEEPGVVETAPATAAVGVAAALSDENVLGLLDSTYALMLRMDQLAQERAEREALREFARGAIPAHGVAVQGIAAVADRLNLRGVYPGEADELLEDQQEALVLLSRQRGAEFDATFLAAAIDVREELLDEIEGALDSERDPAVAAFLREIATNLRAEHEQLQRLRT